MNHNERMEAIALARGMLQVIAIIVIIACTVALYKVRAQAKECAFINQDGKMEATGLYGNCTWMDNKTISNIVRGKSIWTNQSTNQP
jgi:hypothetical protein